MQTIRVVEKADKDGMLQLRIPLGKPEAEYEVVLVLQPKEAASKTATPEDLGWPPGYFDLAGSIVDDKFQRSPQDVLSGGNISLLCAARANQATLAGTAQIVFASLGISCQPIEAEAAQRQMLAEGVRAEDNSFSRGIVEMREE